MLWKSKASPGLLERLAESSGCHPAISNAFGQLDQYVARGMLGVDYARSNCNEFLSSYNLDPMQLVLLGLLFAYFISWLLSTIRSATRAWLDKGWKQVISGFVLDLPVLRSIVSHKQQEAIAKIREALLTSRKSEVPADSILTLPKQGISAAQIKQRLGRRTAQDISFSEGDSRVSGTVYMAGAAHQVLLSEVYKRFTLTNPLHADVFPSVRKMEAEVVAMTASLLGGGPAGDCNVCGSMTSGGTESILTAVKAMRDAMAARRKITEPEMVVGVSAHPAFIKAAEYFKIRLVRVNVDSEYRVTGAAVARAIGRNTILVVASAPGFPHGVMDRVQDIAKVCHRRAVPLHVDCCLGGFVLPFARELGYPIPAFDFSVPGVTSMSADTHKFGQAHKGTSVVLFRDPSIRRFQYTSVTDWTGGLYISPGFAGSRSGALIATAWAALVHLGREGFLEATAALMNNAARFIEGVGNIKCLEVIGKPDMCVVAFRSTRKDVDIYRVNDLMAARGWSLNALQRPASLHICFTPAHGAGVVDELLRDLEECVAGVLSHPEGVGGESMAPLYGMAGVVPDRRIVGNFLAAIQDTLLEP